MADFDYTPCLTSHYPSPEHTSEPCKACAVVGGEIRRNRFGEYLAVRQWYATPEPCALDRTAMELLLHSQRAKDGSRAIHPHKRGKWIFLDTETTGFIAETGNLAFLVGLAWWDAGGIQIEQLFMRDPAEEYSILFELARRLRERPVLVTFNGKSFDWPLLQRRFQMTRRIAVPRLRAHLDFLHPAREIWKLAVGSSKLGHLEEHVLGFESLGWSRREDIDASQIPGAYFDYASGRAYRMESVFRHNRMDLRGLAALVVRILQMLAGSQDASENAYTALEMYGLSRFLGRRRRHQQARCCCESALRRGLPAEIAASARQELARYVKRELRQQRSPRRELRQQRSRRALRTGSHARPGRALNSQMGGPARE